MPSASERVLPSVEEVLELEVLARGRPHVVSGSERLLNKVRWVHVSELADIAHLLRGGELVLTTGVALPDSPGALANYIADLAGAEVAGLVVELGRHFQRELPASMVRAADKHHLPLVALDREVAFVAVTEAVHSRIIDVQLEELRASEQLHSVFTELSLEGASIEEILRQVCAIGGAPVVLENLAHQVVAAETAQRPTEEILDGWEDRSRLAQCSDRVGYDAQAGLLISRVGARGEDWGRLVLVCDTIPTTRQRILMERATTALALNRLIEQDQAAVQRLAERTLIAELLERSTSEQSIVARAKVLGVPMVGRQLVGLTMLLVDMSQLSSVDAQSITRALSNSLAATAHAIEIPTLAGVLREGEVSALLSLHPRTDLDHALRRLCERFAGAGGPETVVAVGSVGHTVAEARRSLQESRQVATVARSQPRRAYHRLADLGVRGLLHLMRDDPRLQTYMERQLGPLLGRDARERQRLMGALAAYLEAGGNKKAAAEKASVSRSVLYQRLARIERLLGVDLEDGEQVTSLHLALLLMEQLRS